MYKGKQYWTFKGAEPPMPSSPPSSFLRSLVPCSDLGSSFLKHFLQSPSFCLDFWLLTWHRETDSKRTLRLYRRWGAVELGERGPLMRTHTSGPALCSYFPVFSCPSKELCSGPLGPWTFSCPGSPSCCVPQELARHATECSPPPRKLVLPYFFRIP